MLHSRFKNFVQNRYARSLILNSFYHFNCTLLNLLVPLCMSSVLAPRAPRHQTYLLPNQRMLHTLFRDTYRLNIGCGASMENGSSPFFLRFIIALNLDIEPPPWREIIVSKSLCAIGSLNDFANVNPRAARRGPRLKKDECSIDPYMLTVVSISE